MNNKELRPFRALWLNVVFAKLFGLTASHDSLPYISCNRYTYSTLILTLVNIVTCTNITVTFNDTWASK